MPASLTSEGVIKVLLSANLPSPSPPAPAKMEEKLAITPNYIRSPVLGYKVDTGESRVKEEKSVIQEKRPRIESSRPSPPPVQRRQIIPTLGHEMILKVRLAGSEDPDYIEIELPGDSLTLDSLTLVASTELGVEASRVTRLRRMPNTRLRRDKEVSRLPDYQEIELVLSNQN